MAKTLKDLVLALLNATLVLIALCLFLGWKLASSVDNITTSFSENLKIVTPLREEAQGIRGELAALRSDLAAIPVDGGTLDSATTARIAEALDKLNAVENKLQSTQARFAEMAESPDILIEQAIDLSADAVADRVKDIRGCVPET
ncbi:hypothetical protein [uncultured Ruegeria sp.]|jgi:3'-phosphoadenosine 5'-phosphosulfate sulfotransferase (PAPS reductase)/FAD synthetase|uniref:hypothetical protein n=1 Tax=uncultured Ruegeria sp. TaxID=259304 RepID=UPI002627C105|nr:hypothetical protein [uncultured Ruegeria sp.]